MHHHWCAAIDYITKCYPRHKDLNVYKGSYLHLLIFKVFNKLSNKTVKKKKTKWSQTLWLLSKLERIKSTDPVQEHSVLQTLSQPRVSITELCFVFLNQHY